MLGLLALPALLTSGEFLPCKMGLPFKCLHSPQKYCEGCCKAFSYRQADAGDNVSILSPAGLEKSFSCAVNAEWSAEHILQKASVAAAS